MTKSIQDYRNIVKILKLQLLKVRQQNTSLSHQMGIISQSETSSFTPKLNKYKQSEEPFSQKVMLFLEFAHRCQLLGISPQMVFRIADKKRDKSVSVSSFIEVMKRVKIRMSEDEMAKMVGAIAKGGSSLQYEQYLQCLSAFQINSEKYPSTSSRTFVQLSLIEFAKTCKPKYQRPRQLFSEIAQSGSDIYFKYDKFVNFCTRNCNKMRETEIVGVFLALDIQGFCKIQKEIFQRELDKIYSLIQRGLVDEKSFVKDNTSKVSPKKKVEQKIIKDDDFGEQESDQGDQAFNTKKKQQKKPSRPSIKASTTKLDKGMTKNIEGVLRQNGFEFIDLVTKLLQKEKEKKDPYLRSFSLGDINEALLKLNKKFPKKDVMTIFKTLDKGGNGSASSEELVKVLIRTDEKKLVQNIPKFRALLYRHLKEIQFPNPVLKFTSLGYKPEQKVTEEQLKQVFDKLQLSPEQMQFIFPLLLNDSSLTIEQFCTQLKKQPSSGSRKEFKKMKKDDYEKLSTLVNDISKKRQSKGKSNYKKFTRLQDLKAAGQSETWNSIFQNEWDCFEYCLQTAFKLQTFWRDEQFGPTKSDEHGLRSIIGNQSERPPALPDDEDIMWMTFEEILSKKQLNEEVVFMRKDLKSTDIVQGTLGDCWYVSALSIITQNDEYIKGKPVDKLKQNPSKITEGMYPPLFHFFANYGLYVFKFFKKFKPVYVVVDDLFPVEASSNTLIFAKSPQPELQWVAFAEKAYAKLHHAYSNMISGDIAQGLNDLTNSIPIKQILKLQDQQNIDKIRELSEQKQLMGCSIKIPKDDSKKSSAVQPPFVYEDQRCGLLAGHAYSIIDYIDLKTSQQDYKLIRVRNPHGHSEWLLDWSDSPLNDNEDYAKLKTHQQDIDQHYNQRVKQARKNNEQEPVPYKPGNDGEFLMNISDWNNIFNNLFIGVNEGYEKFKNGYMYQTIDAWGGKKPSGVCKSKGASQEDLRNFVKNNHQYIMEVKEETEVLMLMSQHDGRLYRGEKYPYKELVCASIILVFRLENESELKSYKKEKMTDDKRALTLQARRDVDYWSTYGPGKYAILPVRKDKDQKINQFQFRLFTNNKIALRKIDSKETFAQSKIQTNQPTNSSVNLDKKVAQTLINYLAANNPKFQKI